MKHQLFFDNGSIGYIDAPDDMSVEQAIVIDGVAPTEITEIHVDDDKFMKLIEDSQEQHVTKDKKGKFTLQNQPLPD